MRLPGLRRKRRQFGLPDGMRIYAIGDVHGRIDLLDRIFSRIDAHLKANPIVRPVQVLLGDYIDRGPASCQVLDLLIRRSQSHETVYLKGNHETFVFEFLRDPETLTQWGTMGGLDTLRSYGIRAILKPDLRARREMATEFRARLPKAHRLFLGSLPSSFSCGGYFFVHAGVRPGVPLSKQRDEDLLWIRDDFLLHEEKFEKVIVHGHTPVREVDVRDNRVNIDTGAYATGELTCLMIEGNAFEVLSP